jgi:hypothetical protein
LGAVRTTSNGLTGSSRRNRSPNGIHKQSRLLLKERLTRAKALCRANGLALTVQRRVIHDALLDRTDHPTAKAAREEGSAEIADWFETLAKAEKSHAGKKPLHPMSILARAYREDGFPTPAPNPKQE